MKIIQLVDSLNYGGTERMSVNMANLFSGKGIQNSLVSTRKGGPMLNGLNKNTHYLGLKKKNGLDVFTFLELFFFVRKYNPDLIHAHSTSIYWAVLIKILSPRIKLIWHDHFGLSDQLNQYPRREMGFFLKFVDALIVVNEKLESWWKAKQILSDQNIHLLSNFPSVNSIVRDIWNNPVRIIQLANFRKQKDHITMLRALKLLCLKGYDFRVSLIGEIIEKDYFQGIKDEILELGLSEKITTIGPSSEVNFLLNNSDIGVLSSESEGLPVALLEYGLAALPIACTDVGDCKKVLPDKTFGWLVPPNSPDKLADALINILENREEALQAGKNLQLFVKENFGSEKFYRDYQHLLGSLGVR